MLDLTVINNIISKNSFDCWISDKMFCAAAASSSPRIPIKQHTRHRQLINSVGSTEWPIRGLSYRNVFALMPSCEKNWTDQARMLLRCNLTVRERSNERAHKQNHSIDIKLRLTERKRARVFPPIHPSLNLLRLLCDSATIDDQWSSHKRRRNKIWKREKGSDRESSENLLWIINFAKNCKNTRNLSLSLLLSHTHTHTINHDVGAHAHRMKWKLNNKKVMWGITKSQIQWPASVRYCS